MSVLLDEGLVRDIAEAHGGSARGDYSGRGMYGDTCLGVVFDNLQDFLGAFTELVISFPHHAEELENVETDDMGLGTIYYWRGIQLVGVEATCRFCDRTIQFVDRLWIDPEATGDDSLWRETCDSNDNDRISAHEPTVQDV